MPAGTSSPAHAGEIHRCAQWRAAQAASRATAGHQAAAMVSTAAMPDGVSPEPGPPVGDEPCRVVPDGYGRPGHQPPERASPMVDIR